jgi:hypothetical protein
MGLANPVGTMSPSLVKTCRAQRCAGRNFDQVNKHAQDQTIRNHLCAISDFKGKRQIFSGPCSEELQDREAASPVDPAAH